MRWFWTFSFWVIEIAILFATIPLVLFLYLPLVILKAAFAAIRAMASGRRNAQAPAEAG